MKKLLSFCRFPGKGYYMKAKQLPSGNYRVQVIDGYDENGKRIVRSFTAATDWEAMKMADDYKKGLYKKPCELTVHEAFEKYLESRDNILSPSTIKGYNTIKEARLQLIRNTKLCDLTISDVQRAVNNDAKRLSRKSIKSALALLKSAMMMQEVDITFHTLRHEFASTLNDPGVPSDYIQKPGGWSTDNVMKSVYTHTSSTKEKMYQEIIDDYFNGIIDNVTQKSHKRAITL